MTCVSAATRYGSTRTLGRAVVVMSLLPMVGGRPVGAPTLTAEPGCSRILWPAVHREQAETGPFRAHLLVMRTGGYPVCGGKSGVGRRTVSPTLTRHAVGSVSLSELAELGLQDLAAGDDHEQLRFRSVQCPARGQRMWSRSRTHTAA